jgi:hypothetical protein
LTYPKILRRQELNRYKLKPTEQSVRNNVFFMSTKLIIAQHQKIVIIAFADPVLPLFILNLKVPPRSSSLLAASFLVVDDPKNLRLLETPQGGHWVPLFWSFSCPESPSIRSFAIYALLTKATRFKTIWHQLIFLLTGFLV